MAVKKGYKQTEVGVLPEDWQSVKLGSIASFKSGIGIEVSKLDSDSSHATVPVFGGNGIAGYTIRSMVSESTLVIGRVGQKCGEVYLTDGPAWITDNALFPRTLSGKAIIKYLAIALRGAGLNSFKNRNDLPLVTQTILDNVTIPLPPTIAEQHAIAGALSDADAWIESLKQLIATKRQIKQGAMQELLTGKRRLPGFSGKWQKTLLGDVITHCSSGATPYRGRPDYYTGTIRWITSGELNYNVIMDTIEHISEEALANTNLKLHPTGTFLMAITGLEAAGTRGSCGIVGAPSATNQSCMAVYPNSRLTQKFLFHSYVYRGDELALKYCQGTKQQSYTASLVKLLPIDLPPTIDEQTAIATVLSDMDTEIESLESKLAKAREVKQGMMQELLTGRIRLIEN